MSEDLKVPPANDQNNVRELYDGVEEFLLEGTDHLLALKDLDPGPLQDASLFRLFRSFFGIRETAKNFSQETLTQHMAQLSAQYKFIDASKEFTLEMVLYYQKGMDYARKLMENPEMVREEFDYTPIFLESGLDDLLEGNPAPIKLMPVIIRPVRVAIIDDEVDICDILKEMFSEEVDLTIETFQRPKKDLERILEFRPEIMLSDFNMPQMNGLELAKAVHEKFPDIPILLLSGYINKDVFTAGIYHNIYAFLEKPFDERQILQYIRESVGYHRIQSQQNSYQNTLLYLLKSPLKFEEFNDQDKWFNQACIDSFILDLANLKKSIYSTKRTLQQVG